jgi:hypothetical protein
MMRANNKLWGVKSRFISQQWMDHSCGGTKEIEQDL